MVRRCSGAEQCRAMQSHAESRRKSPPLRFFPFRGGSSGDRTSVSLAARSPHLRVSAWRGWSWGGRKRPVQFGGPGRFFPIRQQGATRLTRMRDILHVLVTARIMQERHHPPSTPSASEWSLAQSQGELGSGERIVPCLASGVSTPPSILVQGSGRRELRQVRVCGLQSGCST